MNILILAPDVFYEMKNSNAIHLHEVRANLSKKFNVYTIARGTRDHALDEDIYTVKEIINAHPFRTLTASINAFITGLKVLKIREIDIIYERHHIFDLGIILSKLFNIPIILEVNGLLIDEAKICKSYGSALQKANYIIENIFIKEADGIIAVTQGIKDDFVNRGVKDDRIHIVANGANTELFRPMDQNEAQKLIGLDSRYKYICFVGNLAPWQGVEYLIQAAPYILKECPEVRFLIVGDGKMMGEMKNMALRLAVFDKFIFTGMVPYEQVPYYINASTICVAPFIITRNEKIGLSPLKMYEYLACGKPVIASNIPGVKQLLDKSDGGFLVEPEDSEELANAIIKLLHNDELRKDMGIRGRKYIVENHSWGAVAGKIAEVCERSINKRGKHRQHE